VARPRLDADRLAAAHERDGRRLLVFFTGRTYDAQLAVDLVRRDHARAFEQRRRFAADTAGDEAAPLTAVARPVAGSLGRMAAPRPLVVLTLVAVTVAAISISILAWIAIGTARDVDRVVDDASRSVRRLDRTTRDLDPAVRSLRRAADALREVRTTAP
jgi:hypothetical protein